MPEVFLAREVQTRYATIGIVTDYDCWMEDPAKHVTVAAMLEKLYRKSLAEAQELLDALLLLPLPSEEPEIRTALRSSLITAVESLPVSQQKWLNVLQR